jgi:hypothetical protein
MRCTDSRWDVKYSLAFVKYVFCLTGLDSVPSSFAMDPANEASPFLHAQDEPENFIPVCSTLCMQNVFNHSHTHSLSDLWQIDFPLASFSKTRDPTRMHWAISKLDNVANLKWTKKTNSYTNCQCFFFLFVMPSCCPQDLLSQTNNPLSLSFHFHTVRTIKVTCMGSQTYNSGW